MAETILKPGANEAAPKLISATPSIGSIVAIRRSRLLATSVAALAGLYHLVLASYLFSSPDFTRTTYGQDAVLEVPGFFILLAGFQLVWAWITLKEKQEIMLGIGTMGFLASIVLYLTALAAPLPFGVLQQTISAPGLVAKIIEITYVISSVSIIRNLPRERGAAQIRPS